jgi:hypothetical protein
VNSSDTIPTIGGDSQPVAFRTFYPNERHSGGYFQTMDPELFRLPDGTTVFSVLLTDTMPPRHSYAVHLPSEPEPCSFDTLAEVSAFLRARQPPDQ